MQLKIDISRLEKIREGLGVPLKAFEAKKLDGRDPEIIIKRRLVKGVEIAPSELETVGPFLTYQGVQAILYIKDTMQTLNHIRYEKDKAKKFHVVWCSTLNQKRRDGTFENRYVMTRRTDGIFKVDAFIDEFKTKKIESEEELYVCQNCLGIINYQNFSDLPRGNARKVATHKFEIEPFLDEYEGVVRYLSLPKGTDKTEPLSEYDSEFSKRAPKVKQKAHYCCEECGVDLSSNRRLLHCHHKNHKKHDNKWVNLSAICALCHKENHHAHMHVPKSDELEIQKLRQRQGKKPKYSSA